ncbi:MAG: segregation and condensation protein segregation and condensation protein [Candidatus Parcubacteria bacterium]
MQEIPRYLNMNELSSKIQAILLYAGGSMRVKEIAKLLEADVAAVAAAATEIQTQLVSSGSGIRLINDVEELALATAPEHQELIDALRRSEIEGPLGKAGLETLSIILYRGPSTRADIEYIRGVNTQTTLRSLMMRGLISRAEKAGDKRSFVYSATTEVPAYLGVSSASELPGYDEVRAQMDAVLATQTVQLEQQNEQTV